MKRISYSAVTPDFPLTEYRKKHCGRNTALLVADIKRVAKGLTSCEGISPGFSL
jgi:hypothetical protein